MRLVVQARLREQKHTALLKRGCIDQKVVGLQQRLEEAIQVERWLGLGRP